jgi:hypothetical protein
MGATDFTTRARGRDAQEAFNAAQIEAIERYGTEGYTGTIKEKLGGPVLFTPRLTPTFTIKEFLKEAEDMAFGGGLEPTTPGLDPLTRQAIIGAAKVYNDKWDDCAAVRVPGTDHADGTAEYLFFGIASC